MNRFEQKVVIVTGAAAGIGFEIAKRFANEGAKVILNDMDEVAVNMAVDLIGNDCIAIVGDASSVPFIYEMVNQVVKIFGRLDICIANAGLTQFGNFLEFTESDFDAVMNLNLKGSFFLAQAFAKQIQSQGKGGKFLVMSSVVGTQSFPDLAAYSMSKAALKMMARGLVQDFSKLNININCVAPGATLTARTALENEDYEGAWSSVIPLQTLAYPEDIASTVCYLCSEEARHIQGQTIMVDGGWTALSPLPPNRLNKDE